MCGGAPSMPEMPAAAPPPPAPPPAPAPPPLPDPVPPTAPPVPVTDADAAKVKKRTSAKAAQQQASQGAAALRIPLNTGEGAPGSAGAAAKKAGGLNIPK